MYFTTRWPVGPKLTQGSASAPVLYDWRDADFPLLIPLSRDSTADVADGGVRQDAVGTRLA